MFLYLIDILSSKPEIFLFPKVKLSLQTYVRREGTKDHESGKIGDGPHIKCRGYLPNK
jgi:hypothetical protein